MVQLGASIPRVLHQTFKRDMAPELAANVAATQKLNPDWEYRFYDDQDIVKYVATHYGDEIAAYLEAINPQYAAARADLFRYLLIYREGGVYLDIKSQTTKPLSDVIRPDDQFLLSQWRHDLDDDLFSTFGYHDELSHIPDGEYQQWFIAAAPGHPFVKAAAQAALANLRSYRVIRHSVGKPAVIRTTGPIPYTLAIHPILDQHPHRVVCSEEDLGLRYSIYTRQGHEAALGTHYSEVEQALVRGDVTAPIALAVRRGVRIVRSTLARRRVAA